MSSYTVSLPRFHVSHENGLVVIENEFVRWAHDPAQGGEVSEAIVKNGSGKNLLVQPQSSACGVWVSPYLRGYDLFRTASGKADTFEVREGEAGNVFVEYTSHLCQSGGNVVFDGVTVRHTVDYRTDGLAVHAITFRLEKDLDIICLQVGNLFVRNTMTTLGIRQCKFGTWPPEGQNPCRWYPLELNKWIGWYPVYDSCLMPLSVLFLENGVEGIQMSRGDDLGAWENLSATDTNTLEYQNYHISAGAPCKYYASVFSPLSGLSFSKMRQGEYTFTYTLALPYVRKNIVPLMQGGGFLVNKTFEERWPTEEHIRHAHEAGLDLLRLHNDGDGFGNGIFWRDASYPPYPESEMKKMDHALSLASKYGVSVVPYFSVKEYHPEAGGYRENADSFSRQLFPGHDAKQFTYCGGKSVYGVQMCLESGWFETRKNTIDVTLGNHAFNGMYFDWCMGTECINPAHNHGRRHWDNDKLTELVEWSRAKAGPQGKLYLHLTGVPALHLENMADLVLTEENPYSEIFPEMFSPHVHFLNVAPRSICIMLSGDDALRKLALAALLHHATLSHSGNRVLCDFYSSNKALFDSFTEYERHTAPGEGITRTDSRKAGMSLYWKKNGDGLAILANLSDEVQTVDWAILMNGKKVTGTTELQPVSFVSFKVQVPSCDM